jgi:ABC-type uncharacterized transport system fused permease/ATPase subunit
MLLNSWNACFYDALQHKNSSAFTYELLIFTALVAAFILPSSAEPQRPRA